MTVGTKIQQLRKEQGFSQEELAKKLLVSRQTVSQWETDQTLPSIDNIYRLKEIFQVSFDTLLSDEAETAAVLAERPQEEYRFSYTKEDVNASIRLSHGNAVKRAAINSVIFLALLTFLIATNAPGVLIGFFITFEVLFLLTLCKSVSVMKKEKQKMLKSTETTVYHYAIFADRMAVSVFRQDQLNGYYVIQKPDITGLWETETHYVFLFKSLAFTVNKALLLPGTRLPFFFEDAKRHTRARSAAAKRPSFAGVLSGVLIGFSVLSLFIAMPIVVLITDFTGLIPQNMWVFFLFAPFPIASVVFGIWRKRKQSTGTANIVVGCIMLSLLCIYGSFSFIFKDNYTYDYQVVSQWEETVGIDLPDTGQIYTQDYSDYTQTGDVAMHTKSEIRLKDAEAQKFTQKIINDPLWHQIVPTKLAGCLPTSGLLLTGKHFLLYNLNTAAFNEVPEQSGTYEFVLFTYERSSRTLTIENYSKYIVVE